MSIRSHVILVQSLDGSTNSLVERIGALGIETVLVDDLTEARRTFEERRVLVTSVLIPTDLPVGDLKRELRDLRRVGPSSGIKFVSVGKSPGPDERRKLAAAGLELALWEPYDDGTLRFQLNRAIGGDRDEHDRVVPRVPTYLLARVFVGERAKDAVVYSLSEGGAFLETPRASMDGARMEVELRLPASPVRVKAEVIYSNVPGNLQRPNLPLGMGVCFEDVSLEDMTIIRDYVKQRLLELNV